MDLIRDCLDKQLVDKHGKPMGRVDGLVVEWATGQQPRVAAVEVGAVTQWRRVHPRLGQWVDNLRRKIGVVRNDPCRIEWDKAVSSAIEVIADVEAEKSGRIGLGDLAAEESHPEDTRRVI
jgi:hypothetical protein